MTEWSMWPISVLGTVERGRSRHRPRNDPRLFGGTTPFFQTGDVKAAVLHMAQESQFLSDFGVAQSRVWPPGTLCITIAANIADTAVLAVEGCFPDSVVGLTPLQPLDAYFAKYLIDSEKLRLQDASRGTTQENLSLEKLFGHQFLMPDPTTRGRIAEVLIAFDELIENNRRRIEILEEAARSLYREWFVHFRHPGHESATLIESPLGRIPERWSAESLALLVSTKYGYTESAQAKPVGPRYLRGMDINKTSYIDWSTVPYCPIDADSYAKFRVTAGDVFMIRMADPGKVGICETDEDAVFASYLVRLRPIDNKLTAHFLFFTLRSERYQAWVTGASTGSTRKSVSAKVMTEPLIVVPPHTVLEQFDVTIRPLRSDLNLLVRQNASLRSARDALLPKLVTGRVDVESLGVDDVFGWAELAAEDE